VPDGTPRTPLSFASRTCPVVTRCQERLTFAGLWTSIEKHNRLVANKLAARFCVDVTSPKVDQNLCFVAKNAFFGAKTHSFCAFCDAAQRQHSRHFALQRSIP
jgi:hypothetical protein